MDQRQGAFHAGVGEVGVKFRNLRRGQHAFENDSAGGEARDVKKAASGGAGVADLVEEAVTDDVKFPLEGEIFLDRRAAPDKSHADFWFLGLGRLAKARVVGRDGAPAEELLPFGPDHLLETFLDFLAELFLGRKENHGHAVMTGGREVDVLFLGHGPEKFIRHLDKYAGTVTRIFLESAGTAVLQVDQNLQALLDDLV